jgi:hypothetical protein
MAITIEAVYSAFEKLETAGKYTTFALPPVAPGRR